MARIESNRIRFNATTLRGLEPPASGRTYVYDTTTMGLALCLTAKGKRTFYRIGRVDGRPVRLRLGTFPEISVEQARKLTSKATGEIADGRDPHEVRQKARQEPTLCDLFEAFMEKHAKPYRKPRTCEEYRNSFTRYLRPWAGRRLSSVGDDDVQALHAKVGSEHGKYAANFMLRLLTTLFNKAKRLTGWTGPNPCRGVTRFPEKSRERFLYPDELPAFFQSLQAEPDEMFRDFFMLLLLTGTRKHNLLAMRWDEVNLQRGLWYIPDSKSGEPLIVHLAEPAVRILERRLQQTSGSEWVFPGRGKTGHLVEPKMAWTRITERAGLQDVRVHDLRRSLGSYMASGGTSLPIVGRALGHKSLQATAVYARIDIDPVRDAVDAATKTILAAGGMEQEQ